VLKNINNFGLEMTDFDYGGCDGSSNGGNYSKTKRVSGFTAGPGVLFFEFIKN
jgi:hypothetical protein